MDACWDVWNGTGCLSDACAATPTPCAGEQLRALNWCKEICSNRSLWPRPSLGWTPLSTWCIPCKRVGEFEAREHKAAENFALAARKSGVRRIIYLGGLAHGPELSPHLRSRAETGDILRSSGIPVIEFQASIVIGSGSASFEMIRALVERLPVMITPRWVNTAAQPIAIEDVIEYLMAATKMPLAGNVIVEIGGRDVISYVGIMREFARQRKLRRWFIRVPVLSLSLSSRWLTLITPVYASVGRCLIESVRNASVVRNRNAAELFSIRPMGITQAIERALTHEDRPAAESRWSDAARRTPERSMVRQLRTRSSGERADGASAATSR